MSSPVTSLRNIGPAMASALARVGIDSAEDLHAVGADAVYLELLKSGERPHFIVYYVLVMALQDRLWTDCKGDEKAALRVRFDAIKAQGHDKDRSDLEAALDELGVVAPKQRAQPTSSRPAKK